MKEKGTILIVDDEEHLQENLVAYLEDEGYIVMTASDGETGLERIQEHTFNLGIIDMRLPGIDGNTFILKAHRMRPDMKFVIHTRSLAEIGIGKEQVFLKPVIDMARMVRVIEKLLAQD